MVPRISAIVPTLGKSPLLTRAVEALRRDGGTAIEILVVHQGGSPLLDAGPADQILYLAHNRGFAGGTNAGIAAAESELIATINDDVLVQPGWSARLIDALEACPKAAAAQGLNLLLGDGASLPVGPGAAEPVELSAADGGIVDGGGIAWGRSWQALQLHRGERAASVATGVRPIFGVSATAAVYRRRCLDQVATAAGIFDARLESYYEDVDLAVRLRARGYAALLVPDARAHHRASSTGGLLGARRNRLLYGNRYLVVASLLGRAFWPRLPLLLLRDAREALAALARGEGKITTGVVAGWARAIRRLPAFAHRGAPVVPVEELSNLAVVSPAPSPGAPATTGARDQEDDG